MKKFLGFNPDQQYSLLQKMGYKGPKQQDDMDNFIYSSPKAAVMMGKYAKMAQSRLDKATKKKVI